MTQPNSQERTRLAVTPLTSDETVLLVEGVGGPRRAPVHVEHHASDLGRLMWGDQRRAYYRPSADHWDLAWLLAPGPPSLRLPPLGAAAMDATTTASWPRRFVELLRAAGAPSPFRARGTFLIRESRGTRPSWMAEGIERVATSGLFAWGHGRDTDVLPTRLPSPRASGRVRYFRKKIREARLPPVLVMRCSATAASIVLDGHDRLLAMLLEGRGVHLVEICEVWRKSSSQTAMMRAADHAALALAVPTLDPAVRERLVRGANSIALAAHGPSAYRDVTPAHPMSIGLDAWRREVEALCRVRQMPVPDDMTRPDRRGRCRR